MAGIEVKYAHAGDHWLTYAVAGTSGPHLVWLPSNSSDIDTLLEGPWRRFVDGLAEFAQVLVFDRRGTGSSDPMPGGSVPTLSSWVDDFLAVTETAGFGPSALLSFDNGGMMALLVAATRPELVTHIVAVHGSARLSEAPDYEVGLPAAFGAGIGELIESTWGTGSIPRIPGSRHAKDPYWLRWWSRFERGSCGRSAAAQAWRDYWDLDLREVLPSVQADVLVLASASDGRSRYLVDHLASAQLAELTDDDWYGYFEGTDFEMFLARTETFVTGRAATIRADRALAAVLFTDIVGSTDELHRRGDAAWRRVLDEHDEIIRRELDRRRGRLVNTTGDGVLATFDTPGNAIDAALSMRDALTELGIEVRAGLHLGEIELRDRDVAGITVHTAARVMGAAAAGEVLVTSTIRDLVTSSYLALESRGSPALKGLERAWELFAVERAKR